MPFDSLTAEDQLKIERYITNYATPVSIEPSENLRTILNYWNELKSNLFHLMGESLILEREVEFEQDYTILKKEYNAAAKGTKAQEFFNILIAKVIEPLWKKTQKTNPIEARNYYVLVDLETFLRNSWEGSSFDFPLPDNKKFRINKGTKITRALRIIAKKYNIPYWEEAREVHAKISTFKKGKGTLCLSIHPLDYMTMSDNSEGWHSCMEWAKTNGAGGDYRSGTVEMMNSPVVLVTYLKHSEKTFEDWNSKIWRELFIVNKDIITNIKGYPKRNDSLTLQALNWIKELAEKNAGYAYYPKVLSYNNEYEEDNSKELRDNNISIKFECNYMYNDTARESAYCYCAQSLLAPSTDYYLNYSGPLNCMICGKSFELNNDDENNSRVTCENCYSNTPVCYCEICGRPIYADSPAYYVDDYTLCEDCYCDETVQCADDGEMHLLYKTHKVLVENRRARNSSTITIDSVESPILETAGEFYIADANFTDFVINPDEIRMSGPNIYVVSTENLTEEFLNLI